MSSKWGSKFIVIAAAAAGLAMGCAKPAGEVGDIREPLNGTVTEVYGPLFVNLGSSEATSPVKPWSAWWLPIGETYLFGEPSSPLQKFDAWAKKALGRETRAAQFYRENVYDAKAVSWEGHCDAWALASILEPEPKSPVERNGVSFGIGDQKALLMLTYEKFDGSKGYGQRYKADRTSVFDDIAPDQFHRFVQAELYEKRRPFIMDKDPSYPVWNTPVWAATINITADAADSRVLHVETWLLGADPWVESYDFVGTRQFNFRYTYDLIGAWGPDGRFRVESGRWTGESMDYHPDYVTAVPERGGHWSRNPELSNDAVYRVIGN